MRAPPTHFTKGPDGHIAYQVLGDGPIDLLLAPTAERHNLDIIWEQPALERFLRSLASFSRLILCNQRGTGLSDPLPNSARFLEDWTSDFVSVLDAVGSERASIFAIEVAGAEAMFFAATHPERTGSLALLNCAAAYLRQDDYPWGFPRQVFDGFLEAFSQNWGTGRNLDFMAPDLAKDERFREWFARIERLSYTRSYLERAHEAVARLDVRGILPSIQAQTLVISHEDVPWLRLGHGRYLADNIPNATYLERPASWGGIYWLQDAEWVLSQVRSFLTGTDHSPGSDDRVLATVLFSDIVGSTKRAAEVGDERWRDLLDEHDALIQREVERFRGRAVKSTGDGVLAMFDGPARAIRCAFAMRDAVAGLGVQIRAGLHTGEVELRGEDVGGIAVHIGARVVDEANPGEVLVSGAIPPLVTGSGIEFIDRGTHELDGVPGDWRLFSVLETVTP